MYSGKDIQVLTGLEAVRKRPKMYVGADYPANMTGLVIEALCLSRAFIMDGKTQRTIVDVCTDDNSVYIMDNAESPGVCMELAEAICEKLHACKELKHENVKDLCVYGLVVVNALSSYFRFQTYRDGKMYELVYEKGVRKEIVERIDCEKWPVNLYFELDKEIFGEHKLDVAHLKAEIEKINADKKIILSIES